MRSINWTKPIGGTEQLLNLVPGLVREVFWKRQRAIKGEAPSKVGTGRAAAWTAEDALQAATLHEMANLGVMLSESWRVWLMVREAMILRQVGGPRSATGAILACNSKGEVLLREFDGADPTSAGLDHRGAPAVFVVVRIGQLIDRIEGRIIEAGELA